MPPMIPVSGRGENFGFVSGRRFDDAEISSVETGLAPSHTRQAAYLPESQKSGFGLEFFHHTLNQLFGVGEVFHDELHIHDRLAGPALALAVDAMLADEGHGVGDQVHGDSEASAGHAHADFEVLEFFLLFVEDGHGQIVNGDVGIILGETAISIQHSAFSQTTLALNWLTAGG